jgi:hypothetical protein
VLKYKYKYISINIIIKIKNTLTIYNNTDKIINYIYNL